MTRSPTSSKPLRLRAAEVAGAALGAVGRGLPGVAGPLLVCAGLWMAWPPLGVLVAGVFLILLDRRVP